MLASDVAAAYERERQGPGIPWLLAATALLIGFSIYVRGLNHDEGQYVGAIALMRSGWPYIDFAYLQTPLQPLVLAPLSLIPAGWLLLAARIANGLFGLATIALLATVLKNRVRPASLLIALGALACTEPFLWGTSLARNDALPMLLLSGAVVSLLRSLGEEKPTLQLALSGLLLGLATSAKISAAVPAAGAVVYIVLRSRQLGPKPLIAFAAGAFVGLLPCFAFAVIAPAQFYFDVFTYSLHAPAQWWTSVGRPGMLEFPHRMARLLRFGAEGVMVVALAAAALDRRRSEDRLLLDLMIIGGAIGSYMPEPAYAQYLIPLLPPLVPRFALALDSLRGRRRRTLMLLTALSCGFGLYYTVHLAIRTLRHGSELVAAVEQGRHAARLAAGRSIVTLSPQVIAGGNTNLDRRFVTGPFLYRTFGPLSADALRYGFSPNWQRIDRALDAQPPGAILVGGETRAHPRHPQGLDGRLVNWAKTHGYKPAVLRERGFTLFIHGSTP
jgi:4-amino-4-deoxy-L-arabinose transferase-like glycosyltransferase